MTTSVCTKLPFGTGPLCATRSASAKPGGGSSQSENVRTGMLARTGDGALRRRFLPARSRTPRSERSIVAGLIARSPARMSGPSCRWPCLSMAATKVGISAFSRLPQIRSDASQRTTSASRTASSWMRRPPRPSVPLAVDPDRRTRIACFRWKPVTASNSSRIRLFSARVPTAYRRASALTSSVRAAVLIFPIPMLLQACGSLGSISDEATPQAKGAFTVRQCAFSS